MSRFQISKEEYESIKAAEKKTKDKNVSRRLHILMMRYEGYKVKEIAEITGMRINSISEMCRRYREQGLEIFVANKYGGNHRSLKEEQEREILERFEKAAEAGQMVTAQEIKRAFDEVRGKDTGRGYIYMLLERHGWRKVMPRSKHPKAASEEACEASKKLKTTWEKLG
ncbi:MAG: winged helix-turn-helix domain-containing protein [Clostridia bacterium]|nr:winged helix-turn-helix domain-containing protein [Clostridia bacterium]